MTSTSGTGRWTRYLYSALLYALVPLLLLRLLWRSRRAPAYRRRLRERFGYFGQRPAAPAIWVHAVSVGETLAAVPVIEELLRDYPAYSLVVTTTTPTGSERVQALFGSRVFHVYAPWDLPGAVYLRKYPSALRAGSRQAGQVAGSPVRGLMPRSRRSLGSMSSSSEAR